VNYSSLTQIFQDGLPGHFTQRRRLRAFCRQ
jgi:hypothetical protein